MLPSQIERIQSQLIRWGYSSRMVELLEPWSLMVHHANARKKREASGDKILVSSSDFDAVKTLDKDYDDKYKGVKTPYHW